MTTYHYEPTCFVFVTPISQHAVQPSEDLSLGSDASLHGFRSPRAGLGLIGLRQLRALKPSTLNLE